MDPTADVTPLRLTEICATACAGNFLIRRAGYGSIFLPGISEQTAAEVIGKTAISSGSVEIQSDQCPNLARELNDSAVITLENVHMLEVWKLIRVRSGVTSEVLSSNEKDAADGVRLVAYDREAGLFRFAVRSFSKYKLLPYSSASSDGGADSSEGNSSSPPYEKTSKNAVVHRPDASEDDFPKVSVEDENCSYDPPKSRRSDSRHHDEVDLSGNEEDDQEHKLDPDTVSAFAAGAKEHPESPLRYRLLETRDETPAKLLHSQEENLSEADEPLPGSDSVTVDSRFSSTMLSLLDRVFGRYLDCCDVRVQESHTLISAPTGNALFLRILADQIWPRESATWLKTKFIRMTFKLIQTLWHHDDLKNPSEHGDSSVTAVMLFGWLREVLADYPLDIYLSLRNSPDFYGRVLYLLMVLRTEDAAVLAEQKGDMELAGLLYEFRADRYDEEFQAAVNVLLMRYSSSSNRNVTKILLLLSGTVAMDGVSVSEGLDWVGCMALYAYYGVAVELSVSSIWTYYMDASFSDSSWSGPPVDLEPGCGEPSPVVWCHIIELFLGLKSYRAIRDDVVQWNVAFRWLMLRAFANLHFSVDDEENSLVVGEFVHALEYSLKLDYAVLVLLHLSPSGEREEKLKRLVLEGLRCAATLSTNQRIGSLEEFYKDSLLISERWLLEGKALQKLDAKDYAEAALLYLSAGNVDETMEVLFHKILNEPGFLDDDEKFTQLLPVLDNLTSHSPQDEQSSLSARSLLIKVLWMYGLLTGKFGQNRGKNADDDSTARLTGELEEGLRRLKSLLSEDPRDRKVIQQCIDACERYLSSVRRQTTSSEPGMTGILRSVLGKLWTGR